MAQIPMQFRLCYCYTAFSSGPNFRGSLLSVSNLSLPANSVAYETFASAKARSTIDHDPSASASHTSTATF